MNSFKRCQAKTKKGKQCSNNVQKGTMFCGPHMSSEQLEKLFPVTIRKATFEELYPF